MNPKLSFLFARRSVRRYRPGAVPPELERDLLEAAMAAPSAVARDPWRFVVVRERATLEAIAEALPNGKMIAEAGLGVIVCGEPGAAHDGQLSYLLQDCSACVENLLLAATALGLGACWLGVHPRQERIERLRAILNLPAEWLPIAAVSIGWPAESPTPRTRFNAACIRRERG